MTGEILNDIRSVLRLPLWRQGIKTFSGFIRLFRPSLRAEGGSSGGKTRNGFVKEVVGGTRFELVTPAV